MCFVRLWTLYSFPCFVRLVSKIGSYITPFSSALMLYNVVYPQRYTFPKITTRILYKLQVTTLALFNVLLDVYSQNITERCSLQ